MGAITFETISSEQNLKLQKKVSWYQITMLMKDWKIVLFAIVA